MSEVDITALLVDQNYASIVAHRPIASEDLRGKQIGYALGSNAHYMLLRLLSGADLSLTKALVDLHGGSLELQSQVGVGTTVTVRFPARSASYNCPTARVPWRWTIERQAEVLGWIALRRSVRLQSDMAGKSHRSLRMILKLIWINNTLANRVLGCNLKWCFLQKHSTTSDVGGFERAWGFRKPVLANGCRFGRCN